MFQSGFVTIMGRPNVGKSTLINQILGEKVSIVSPKPQTTRNNIVGILNDEDYQIVFLDTPGLLNPKNKLDEYMAKSIEASLDGIDIVVYLLDATKPFLDTDIEKIKSYASSKKLILAVNKIDETNFEKLYPKLDKLNKLENITDIIPISAKTGKNVTELVKSILKILPESVAYYPTDLYTDKSERFLVSEIIREKALWYLQQEIPHGIAIEIEQFEQKDKNIQISAVIVCEKDSHKHIIIGKKGEMLKTIGTSARLEIEKLLDTRVNLNLFVKVKKNWRENPRQITNFGYDDDDI